MSFETTTKTITQRGFKISVFEKTYDNVQQVEIQQSSNVNPAIWLRVRNLIDGDIKEGYIHLNRDEVDTLIKELKHFLTL